MLHLLVKIRPEISLACHSDILNVPDCLEAMHGTCSCTFNSFQIAWQVPLHLYETLELIPSLIGRLFWRVCSGLALRTACLRSAWTMKLCAAPMQPGKSDCLWLSQPRACAPHWPPNHFGRALFTTATAPLHKASWIALISSCCFSCSICTLSEPFFWGQTEHSLAALIPDGLVGVTRHIPLLSKDVDTVCGLPSRPRNQRVALVRLCTQPGISCGATGQCRFCRPLGRSTPKPGCSLPGS